MKQLVSYLIKKRKGLYFFLIFVLSFNMFYSITVSAASKEDVDGILSNMPTEILAPGSRNYQ